MQTSIPAPAGAVSRTLRVSPVAAACALVAFGPNVALAQQSASEQTVVVTGIRRAIETSVNTKRNSDSIVEAISAEDLGKLPDASIAEALSRLPGLTGQRGADGRSGVRFTRRQLQLDVTRNFFLTRSHFGGPLSRATYWLPIY